MLSKLKYTLLDHCTNFLFIFSDLGKACKGFAQKLKDFKFECIGEKLTDDEARIGKIFKTATLIRNQ